ncbi:hypothetical protein Bca4012_020113 [Brassica carinata]
MIRDARNRRRKDQKGTISLLGREIKKPSAQACIFWCLVIESFELGLKLLALGGGLSVYKLTFASFFRKLIQRLVSLQN